ncbi:MAG: hypothetical protein HOP29_07450 [Phycisphaerales bacterium]|nr:hypothetical protein [Phycisphaerales bacterium]
MGAKSRLGISEYVAKLIRIKAEGLVGHFGFTRSDADDIESELTLHVQSRMTEFNPRRAGVDTFASRIVDRKVVSIIRHRTAARRDYRRIRSIDDAAGDDERMLNAALVVEGTPSDLAIDLAEAIGTLDSDSWRFCDALVTAGSIAEAGRRLGLTRGAARARVTILRKRFADAGIGIYVDDETTESRGAGVCN